MKRSLLVWLIVGLLCVAHATESEDDDVKVETEEEEIWVEYESPTAEPGKYHFAEHFDDIEQVEKRWVRSKTKKEGIDEDIAKYDGVWYLEEPKKSILRHDLGLVLKSKAKHAAISAPLDRPFVFADKPLVVQYEVMWQDGQECGGSYIKLLSEGKETKNLGQFQDKTPYTIMFGPDKCGNDAKLHFIFRHVNPINGTITEKHCKKPKDRLEEPFKDKQPHLYQLVVKPDNTFVIRVDHNIVNEGSLLLDFTPPVNPPREIDDPNDKKPEDWDERERIPDPEAKKPDTWDDDAPPQIPDESVVKPEGWLDDEEEMIHDPNAKKPEDWDIEIDGEWEPPLMSNPLCEKAVGCGLWKAPLKANPAYKGKWKPNYIDNPNYKGKWSPRKIPNPDFYEDLMPFKMTPIAAVGFELWSMSADILFDNLIIADNEEVARDWAADTFDMKRKQIDKQAESLWSRVTNYVAENPWVYAAAIFCIGLPSTLLYCCYCSGSKDKVDHKKGDAPTSDETLREEDDGAEEEVPLLEEENAQGSEEEDDDEEAEKNSDPEGEEEVAAEEKRPPSEPVAVTRKRRPRKD